MLNLKLTDELADDIFEMLQEIISRAKTDGNKTLISYATPVLAAYAEALINARPKKSKRGYLIRPKAVKQS